MGVLQYVDKIGAVKTSDCRKTAPINATIKLTFGKYSEYLTLA